MNIEKHLILIKGEDKTAEVSYCKYESGKWHVQFGSGKVYPYNYDNVQWFKNPTILDSETTVVYQNNQPLSGVAKIIDFGEYIRICYVTGYRRVYARHELTIEESCLREPCSNDCFAYLSSLAAMVSVTSEEDKSFLSKQYEKISYVSPNSVLAKYLSPSKVGTSLSGQMPIFPFGFNLSQKTATENALSHQISVIEGPPGTGKTQTILNILANAAINGKTVAVVSNNNSATANVLEKLQKYGVDFIAAYLGRKDNKERFVEEQTGTYPNMRSWKMKDSSYTALREKLIESGSELNKMLKIRNKVALLKEERSGLLIEEKHFQTYYVETFGRRIEPYRSLFRHNSDVILALWLDYQQMAERDQDITLVYKLKNLIRYGIVSFAFYNNSREKVISFFQKLYYQRKIQEVDEEISTLTKQLKQYHFEQAMQKYSEDSMKLFKAKLAEKYFGKLERRIFTEEELWKDFASFIAEYPVVMSTTHSLRNCASPNYLFDYVIIDEASQVDVVTGALALSCARNSVVVGDLMQLPNVVPDDTVEATSRVFERYKLSEAYHYAQNSILSSITKLFKDVPRTLLREHYRCHPKIIGFCNQKFYNNELIVLTEEEGREKPLVAYKTAQGNHARGRYNQRQIDVIKEEILPGLNGTKHNIGIISPYRLQTNKLREAIEEELEIDTVHKYQGRERDVVILTTVVNEVNDFVDNPNLLNVAVSRAVDKLIVVVSDNDKNENSNIGDLVRYIDYNNCEVINSEIYSVFDLLYRRYSEQLMQIRKQTRKVSKYDSENLMNVVIEKVLSRPEFQNLDRVMHQPLKMLIRNPEKLDEDEARYALNILTHTDFVIFNKLDKMPVLVVEVDGYAFHANNPKQLERDKLKDKILEKYGIPIIRIKTNESGEEGRLYEKLNQVLNEL